MLVGAGTASALPGSTQPRASGAFEGRCGLQMRWPSCPLPAPGSFPPSLQRAVSTAGSRGRAFLLRSESRPSSPAGRGPWGVSCGLSLCF